MKRPPATSLLHHLSRIALPALLMLAPPGLHAGPLPAADAPRESWRAVLPWPQGCEDDWVATGNGSGITTYRLPDGRSLVEVACTPGAYQGYQLYFLPGTDMSASQVPPLVFPLFEDTGGRPRQPLKKKPGSEVWGTPEFDAARGRLLLTNRFRGPGDCGTRAIYAFGRAGVRLVELRAKRSCDGRGAEHPERWPRVPVPK